MSVRSELLQKYNMTRGEPVGSGTGKSSSGSVRRRLLDKAYGDVNEGYINSFLSDARAFLDNAEREYGGMNYGNAASSYETKNSSYLTLKTKSAKIRGWLDLNKTGLEEETYNSLTKMLDDYDTASSGLIGQFKEASDYYSQWKTEDEYNKHVSDQKEYEKKLNFDLEAGQKEIEDLEAEYEALSQSFYSDEHDKDTFLAMDQKMYEYEDAIREKKLFLDQAKRLQEGLRLSSVADPNSDLYDPDFEEKSKYVSTKSDGIWGNLTSRYGMGYDDLTYEYINGAENGMREEIKQKHRRFAKHGGDGESTFEENGYDYMNEDEINIYNYYYSKDGKKAAEKYLDSIQETLNHRKATSMYANMEGKTLLELAFAVTAGLDQFESGIKSLINTEDNYIPVSATQMASGMVREDLEDDGPKLPKWLGGASLGQVGYDAITTTANMAPSILTSMAIGVLNPVAGEIAGTALMGASAAGNAYQEALNLGYDKGQARAYSTLVGSSEAGLQYLFGGIGKLGGKLSGNALTKVLNGVDNAFARTALKLGGNMLSEGLEEGLQEVLTPWFKNLTLHTDEDVNWSEVAYSSLLGALTAGFMEGTSTISGEVNTYKTGKQLKAADISATRLAELGKTFSADTVAYQLAGRVDENTGAYTLGRLFNEIGATLSEQNVTEITNALVGKGMDTSTARKNAEALAIVVEGGQLSKRQIAVIEANDVLAEVARTTLIDANTTWNQRAKGYNEMLKALADEMTAPKTSRTKTAQQSEANAPTADTVDTRNKNAPESSYEAAAEGQMIRKDTGETVRIKEVASLNGGKMTLRLEDGSEVDSWEVAYSNPGEAYVFETVANLGVDAVEATRLVNAFRNSGVEGRAFADGMKLAFEYGYGNFSQQELAQKKLADNIPKVYINTAYEIGQKMRQQESGNGVQYSFKGYANDGKGIYESNFPKGTPKKAKGERILKYIQDVWSKKPITLRINDNGTARYIKAQFDPNYDETEGARSDARKLMGGNRHGNATEQRVTLDLADDYYQIASESEYNYSKDETGKDTDPHQGVKRWHYFINDIYFAEQGSEELTPYRVSINVKENSDGNFFYSFSAEKAEGTSTQRTLHAAVNSSDTTANGSSSKTSIRNPGETVNKKVSGKAGGVYYTTKDGKVLSMSQAEKNGKLALKDKQSVAVKTAKFLQKLGLGGNYYFFESYVDQNGHRVFKDRFGNIQSAPNGLYYSDGDIYIDINAGTDSHSITLRTLSHELTHMIQQWSAAKYKVMADFLAEQYAKEGRNAYEAAKAKQEELSQLRGRSVPFQEAYHEFVADSMSTLFDDGNMYEILTALKKKDKTLVDYIKKFFDDLVAKVRSLYANTQAETDEGQFVQGLSKHTVYRLQQLFADALADASENYATSEQKSTDTQIGVQQQTRMTDADIQRVQSIGRISVNQFSPLDIKATERFAQQYWKEMGVKSPFFRAWFGDWRVNDQTRVQVATQKGDTRGVQKNEDTGWDIQVSGKVFNETKRHTASYNVAARQYLPYINDIVQKAVLLDSFGINTNKTKSSNSLLMHSMYVVADLGNGQEILKLYVEEMNDPNKVSTNKRVYQLQDIEKYQPQNGSSQKTASSISSATGSIHTVADLFAAVKQKDADFNPNPASDIVDAKGKPKAVYHGSAELFNTFSYGHIGNATGVGILGSGFYFTDQEELARNYGNNLYECFLQMKKPYKAGESDAYKLNAAKLQAQGYDGVILEAPSGTVYMVFNNTQIKSATGNIGTFDGSNPDIRYQDRAATPSNRELLAQALESVAANVEDYHSVKEYRRIVPLLDAEEAKLSKINAKIREMTFGNGKRDSKKLVDLRVEAKQTQNRIDIYDKQLLRLEATAPLQKVLEREKAKAYKRAEQKGKEAVQKEKERAQAKYDELTEKWRESRKKGVESRRESDVRSKIKAFKTKMERSLLNPTDRQYVPIDLIKAMVDVCELIDTDTDLYKADGSIKKAQQKRDETKEKLQNLKDEYEKLKTHSDPIYAGEFDEMVYTYLTKLRNNFSGKSLKEMSLDELTEMYEILRSIDETLMDARKLIGWGDAEGVYEAGDAIVAEQREITQKRKNGKRNASQKAMDKVDNLSLSPVRNVERMSGYNQDSYLLNLFKKFEQGIRKKNKFVMEAYKSFESLTSGKEYDDAMYKEVGGKKYTDVKGRKFGVSKMQMMQAILSWEREMANEKLHHIEKGGFTFADIDKLRKGNLKDAVSAEYSHRVPAATEMVAEFKEILKDDKWCQDYMAAARKFFNETAKDAINETSIALKHRIIAKDKSYIPFEVDTNFVNTEITDMDAVQKTINSYGMLKETKNNAPQALYITGLNNILDRHIEQVGNVYGLAVDVRNFNKVWNVRSKDASGNNPTVKESIDTNWGREGVKNIEQAVKDIQGPRVRDRNALYDKVKSNYIGATFLLNLSVVTKQIGSLYSSTSMLRWRDPARMIGNLVYTMANHKKITTEVDKYTATAWMRRQGMSDAELYSLLTQARKPGLIRFWDKAPTIINPAKWITAMDHAVALSLWRYAKIDTAKRTGLTGEELLKATAEFYDEVVENTQSMTDVLHRPEIQKRGDVVSETFAMFKTDLYQMAGQLQATTGRFMADKSKENGKALVRTVYSIAMGAIWGQLMTTVFALLRYKVKAYRDEEDEELTVESWLKRQGVGFAGDLMGYIFPVFGSEVVGFFENIMYGESEDIVDSIALSAINDLYNAMITIGTAVKDKEMPEPADMKKLAVKALQPLGFPANNILRIVDAIHLHAKDIANGEFFSFEAGVDRSPKHHIHRITEAVDEGNFAVAKGLYEEALEELATKKADGGEYGKDELKEAKTDLRTALGKKYRDGEISKDITNMILSELFGDSPEEVNGKISYWDFKIENPDSDVPSQWFITYYDKVKSSGIALDIYVKYRTLKKELTERDEILKAIDAMSISNRQKDALYFAEGYAESTLDEAPWH